MTPHVNFVHMLSHWAHCCAGSQGGECQEGLKMTIVSISSTKFWKLMARSLNVSFHVASNVASIRGLYTSAVKRYFFLNPFYFQQTVKTVKSKILPRSLSFLFCLLPARIPCRPNTAANLLRQHLRGKASHSQTSRLQLKSVSIGGGVTS